MSPSNNKSPVRLVPNSGSSQIDAPFSARKYQIISFAKRGVKNIFGKETKHIAGGVYIGRAVV